MIGRRIQNRAGTPGVLYVLTKADLAGLETGALELNTPPDWVGFVTLARADDDAHARIIADEIAPLEPDEPQGVLQ